MGPLEVKTVSQHRPDAPQGASWGVPGVSWWPTWPQLGSQDGAKTVKKSMPKSIKHLMRFESIFERILKDFGKGNWRQVGTKIDQKSMPVAKRDFLQNRVLLIAGSRFFKIRGSKLGAKIDQKSIKK